MALKERQGITISAVMPTLNEAATIGPIVRSARRELMERHALIDELVVIDSESDDETRHIAAEEGARVVVHSDILPRYGSLRAFTFGVLSSFLSAISRGGLMFMLIIWLQGIWLPEHGVGFVSTPALGRDPDAAADGRVPPRRPDLGDPLRPLRPAAVRDRRDARLRAQLLPARDAARSTSRTRSSPRSSC